MGAPPYKLPKNSPENATGKPARRRPGSLSPRAALILRRLKPALEKLGVHEADEGVVEAYCSHLAFAEEARERLQADGLIVCGERDRVIPNPYIQIHRQATLAAAQLAAVLGLTPASRQKLRRDLGDEEEDTLV